MYKIIEANGVNELADKVKDQMEIGWKLQGGVSSHVDTEYCVTLYQAMVKDI